LGRLPKIALPLFTFGALPKLKFLNSNWAIGNASYIDIFIDCAHPRNHYNKTYAPEISSRK
jgi:hypothetical protein